MKSLRPVAIALLACSWAAFAAFAADTPAKPAARATGGAHSAVARAGCSAGASASGTATAADHPACTAEMAAQCTPEMRAACEKNAAMAAAMGCTFKHPDATTAVAGECPYKNQSTATAAATGCAMHHQGATAAVAARSGDGCAAKDASMAKGAACSMHGSATAAGTDHCANGGTSATTASATGGMDHCAAGKAGATMAMAMFAGMTCAEHLNGVAHECSACEDVMNCEKEVCATGARAQVVPLKNGAMIVYTADSKAQVKSLQAAIAKRNERMIAALSAGSDKKLCDSCKQLRGAMASGKLHREVVNVERGCMTLITSDDRDVVQKIRAMTGTSVAMR